MVCTSTPHSLERPCSQYTQQQMSLASHARLKAASQQHVASDCAWTHFTYGARHEVRPGLHAGQATTALRQGGQFSLHVLCLVPVFLFLFSRCLRPSALTEGRPLTWCSLPLSLFFSFGHRCRQKGDPSLGVLRLVLLFLLLGRVGRRCRWRGRGRRGRGWSRLLLLRLFLGLLVSALLVLALLLLQPSQVSNYGTPCKGEPDAGACHWPFSLASLSALSLFLRFFSCSLAVSIVVETPCKAALMQGHVSDALAAELKSATELQTSAEDYRPPRALVICWQTTPWPSSICFSKVWKLSWTEFFQTRRGVRSCSSGSCRSRVRWDNVQQQVWSWTLNSRQQLYSNRHWPPQPSFLRRAPYLQQHLNHLQHHSQVRMSGLHRVRVQQTPFWGQEAVGWAPWGVPPPPLMILLPRRPPLPVTPQLVM